MRKNNGDSSWLIYFISVILILAGVYVEPLAAVLGVLIVVVSLIVRIIESGARRRLEKDLKKLQRQSEEKVV